MHGRNSRELEKVTITPDMAMQLLDHNKNNRPVNDQHVRRIARQITEGKWKFNGDTIKLSDSKDIVDGQHRLWAIIESKTAVESIIVYGLDPAAFATVDTLRKPRSGSDILSLHGVTLHRSIMSAALQWLTRWQRKVLLEYRMPANRIENADIEQAFIDNPGVARAAEKCARLRGLTSTSIICFFYFILTNRNPDIAERMIHTLENPSGVGVNDPFFRLRAYLTAQQHKDPLVTIACMIKAANAAYANREMRLLKWANQGSNAEEFPKLEVGNVNLKHR